MCTWNYLSPAPLCWCRKAGEVAVITDPAVEWSLVRDELTEISRREKDPTRLAVAGARLVRSRVFKRSGRIRRGDWRSHAVSVKAAAMSVSGRLASDEFPLRVWVREAESPLRQDFTIAHEVGHWVFDQLPLDGLALEDCCDTFAAELLLPIRLARSRLSSQGALSSRDVLELAHLGNVNLQTAIRQASRAAWNTRYLALHCSDEGRVTGGAGSMIGSPWRGQRLSSMGSWHSRAQRAPVDQDSDFGFATLRFRFGSSRDEAGRLWRSGEVSGTARWDSISLMSGARLVCITFTGLDFLRYSELRAG
jgi:hypothetical protein